MHHWSRRGAVERAVARALAPQTAPWMLNYKEVAGSSKSRVVLPRISFFDTDFAVFLDIFINLSISSWPEQPCCSWPRSRPSLKHWPRCWMADSCQQGYVLHEVALCNHFFNYIRYLCVCRCPRSHKPPLPLQPCQPGSSRPTQSPSTIQSGSLTATSPVRLVRTRLLPQIPLQVLPPPVLSFQLTLLLLCWGIQAASKGRHLLCPRLILITLDDHITVNVCCTVLSIHIFLFTFFSFFFPDAEIITALTLCYLI